MKRAAVLLVALLVLTTACSSTKKAAPDDPVAVLQDAARRTLGFESAELSGSMTADGKTVDTDSGSVDIAGRRASIVTSDAQDPPRYPPFELRFVDGWNYVSIDPVVKRPPKVRPDVLWVAYEGTRAIGIPVPEVTTLPSFPFQALDDLLHRRIVDAHFATGALNNVRTVMIRFADRRFDYLISVDAKLGIVGVVVGGGNPTLSIALKPSEARVVIDAPLPELVQRLGPNEVLYPTTTTIP